MEKFFKALEKAGIALSVISAASDLYDRYGDVIWLYGDLAVTFLKTMI